MNREADVMKLSYYVREIWGYRDGHREDSVFCLVGMRHVVFDTRATSVLFSFIPMLFDLVEVLFFSFPNAPF